jgi:spore cortex biosynthesis protein YabQ
MVVHSFFLGILIALVYDGFLILRRLLPHNSFFVSLEDLLFWAGCAIGVFLVLYKENNGILRWFAVAGAGLGMFLYKKTLSPLIIRIFYKLLSFLLQLLLTPLRFLFGKLSGFGRSAARKTAGSWNRLRRRLKKKLTQFKKTLKILICKQ